MSLFYLFIFFIQIKQLEASFTDSVFRILDSRVRIPCFRAAGLQSDKHQPITLPTRDFFGAATKAINFLTQFLSYDERKIFIVILDD